MQNKDLKDNQKIDSEDIIDLKEFLKLLIRNKKNITIYSIIFFVISCIYALSLKRVWQGKFEIVVNVKQNSSLASNFLRSNNMSFLSNLNLFNSSSNLNTEVGILKSPSVLLPTFNFVNDERKKNNPNFEEIPFTKWKKNNLKIDLKPSTSILSITYRDSNKEIIKPVLSKISNAYQEYSGKSTKRNINLAKEYLNTQIAQYRIKSSESLRNAQAFALDQDLTILGLQSNKTSESSGNFKSSQNFDFSSINIEKIRVNAANNIRNIDKQIENIKIVEDDYEQLQFIGRNIIGFNDSEDSLNKELDLIDTKLAEARFKFKAKDKAILLLEEKKQSLMKLLKRRTIAFLKAQRIVEKANMEAAERPKDVILKYKELIRLANRDEGTLIELENQLRMINLEGARYKDPWELVTKPTLEKSPVFPKRRQIGLIGLILGVFTGTAVATFKDIKSDLIFSEKDIEKLLKAPILQVLNIKDGGIEQDTNLLQFDELINLNKGKLNFISMGKSKINFDLIKKNLCSIDVSKDDTKFKNINFFENNFSGLDDKLTTIFLGEKFNLKYKDLNDLDKKLNLLNIKVDGIILVS